MLPAVIPQMTSVTVSPAIVDNDMLFATTTAYEYNDLTTDSAMSIDTMAINTKQSIILCYVKRYLQDKALISLFFLNHYQLPMIGHCVIWILSYL